MKLREQAYEAFTEQLLTRRLLPGQFVSQRELAAATCMSLASIREMIPRLEAEGLLRAISQRGLQIARVDPSLVHDSFQLREMIELQAVAAFTRAARPWRSTPNAPGSTRSSAAFAMASRPSCSRRRRRPTGPCTMPSSPSSATAS